MLNRSRVLAAATLVVAALTAGTAQAADDRTLSLHAFQRNAYIVVDWGPSDPPRTTYHVFRDGQHFNSTTDRVTWWHDRHDLRRGKLYCYQIRGGELGFGLYKTNRDCIRFR
jgi:hypothetical protein